MCNCLLVFLGLRTDQRLQFPVSSCNNSLPGHFGLFGLSGPLLSICTASPNGIRLCWVCFLVLEADPQFVVLGLLET